MLDVFLEARLGKFEIIYEMLSIILTKNYKIWFPLFYRKPYLENYF